MDALVSQRGNGALLLDDEDLFWLDPTGRKERLARSDLHFLLSGRGDYYSRDDVSESEVLAELRVARDADESLLLTLTLLDTKSSEPMRSRSAARANELVGSRVVARALENLLWSRELAGADFEGGLQACWRERAHKLAAIVDGTRRVQPAIKAVLFALESVPDAHFSEEHSRQDFLFFAIQQGVVHDLVRAASRSENISSVVAELVKKNSFLTSENRALQSWTLPLQQAAAAAARRKLAAVTPRNERRADENRPRTDSRTKVGVVVSNRMQKTVVVAVENLVKHGMYQKYIKRTNKFLAHSESNDLSVGDQVVIEETRPLSKRKRWNVREILSNRG